MPRTHAASPCAPAPRLHPGGYRSQGLRGAPGLAAAPGGWTLPRARPHPALLPALSSPGSAHGARAPRPRLRAPLHGPRCRRPLCGKPREGGSFPGAGLRAPGRDGGRGGGGGGGGRWRRRPGGAGEPAAAAVRRELRRPPPPPRERRAPRPGSHASHVRPLGEAAPRRRPRRVMRTDVKLPYEY